MKKLILILTFLFLSSFTSFAEEVCNFKADLNFLKQVFNLQMYFKEKSQLSSSLNLDDDKFYLNTKIQNLKLNNHIFSTELAGRGQIANQEGNKFLKCTLESKYALLDYKPFKDILTDFMVNRESLIISSFKWGKTNLIGDIGLVPPYEINLYADIHDADINELAALLGFNPENLVISGLVDGFLRFKGPLSNLRINGQLKASNGEIGSLLYREILVKVDGIYPVINLFDCEIIEEDGLIYSFEGKINLAQINNLYSGEHAITFLPLTDEDGFNWHNWTVRRDKEHNNLQFEKRFRSGRTDSLRLRDQEPIDMLGVEQTLKF